MPGAVKEARLVIGFKLDFARPHSVRVYVSQRDTETGGRGKRRGVGRRLKLKRRKEGSEKKVNELAELERSRNTKRVLQSYHSLVIQAYL